MLRPLHLSLVVVSSALVDAIVATSAACIRLSLGVTRCVCSCFPIWPMYSAVDDSYTFLSGASCIVGIAEKEERLPWYWGGTASGG